MKRHKPSKPRTTSLTVDMGHPVEVKSVKANADGTFQFFDGNGALLKPISAFVERSYKRRKSPKVLSQVPLDPSTPMTVNPLHALVAYDTIYALDSNTRLIRGQNISIAAAILVNTYQRELEIKFKFKTMHALEFRETDCHPDLLALRYHIHLLGNNPTIEKAGKVAFIIDSHLGDLSDIRAGIAPVLDNCFLPHWADLIFASDCAQDTLPNKFLKKADTEANKLLNLIGNGTLADKPSEEKFGHASYFRFWNHR